MWRRSFVATTVALGGTVDDALAALGQRHRDAGRSLDALVAGLRAPQRNVRATALAEVVRDIAVAIERVTLR